MSGERQLKIGLAAYGTGWDLRAWRLPEATNAGLEDPSVIVDVTRTADRGKLDYVFTGSSLASEPRSLQRVFRWDNAVYAGFAAAQTSHVGLLISFNTSIEHPYLVARQVASLDRFSGGRAGLNLVYGIERGVVGDNFGGQRLPDQDTKYDRAVEFTDLVYRLLQESWDDDYLLDDKRGGALIKPGSWHQVDFAEAHFDVKGPLNAPPPIQRRIPLVHVGLSERSLRIGAQQADIRFGSYLGLEAGKADYRATKQRVADAGRDPERFLILPGIGFYLGGTKGEARDKFRQISAFEAEEVVPAAIGKAFGIDLSRVRPGERAVDVLDLDSGDAPIALDIEHPFANVERRGADDRAWLKDFVHRQLDDPGVTLGDLYHYVRQNRFGQGLYVGDAVGFADFLEEGLVERVFDGVQLFPPYHRGPADLFVDQVVPELQRRGVFRTEYESTLLSENLGIA